MTNASMSIPCYQRSQLIDMKTRLLHVLFLVVCWGFPASVLTSLSVVAQEEVGLTISVVDERLTQLRDASIPEDSIIYAGYMEVRGLLVQVEVYEREKLQYTESMQTAPVQAVEVQGRIDALESRPAQDDELALLSRAELKARLLATRTELEESANNLADMERRLAARETNSAIVRERLAEVRSKIESMPAEPQVGLIIGQPSEGEAIAWKLSAEHMVLRAERQALETRLSSQPARFSLMIPQRAELALITSRLSDRVKALEAELETSTSEQANAEAMGFNPSDPVYPIIQELVASDTALVEERATINTQLLEARAHIDDIKRQSGLLKERFSIAKRLGDFATDSDTLGKVLLTHWQDLGDLQREEPKLSIPRETARIVIRRIEHEETLRQLGSASGYVIRMLEANNLARDTVDSNDYEAIRTLVKKHRTRLHALIDTQSDYLDTLTLLGERRDEIYRISNEYRNYLASIILWIPDFRPLWRTDLQLLHLESDTMAQDLSSLRIKPGWSALASLLVFALLVTKRKSLLAFRKDLDSRVTKPRYDSIVHSLMAIACDLLTSLPVPILLAGLASTLQGDSTLPRYILNGAVALFLLLFARQICQPKGIGVVHFGWDEDIMARLHRDCKWLVYYWLPLLILIGWMAANTPWASQAILVRSFIVIFLLPSLLILVYNMFKQAKSRDQHWLKGPLQRYRLLFALVLIMIVIAVTLGHMYSIKVLFNCLNNTLWVGLGLLLLYSLLIRWILVVRRRLRMAQLLEAQSASATPENAQLEEKTAKLVDVSDDSRELVSASVAATGLAALLYIWSPLLPAMDKLSAITLWTTTTEVEGELVQSSITLATLLIIIFLASLTLYAARKLPAIIDLLLRSQTSVSASARYTVSSLLNYTIIGTGTVAALSAIGLQWSQLQWLVAALGVGIGFGLQEIIANFISGLIILFERPIRVGDVVSTGDKDGIVTRIRIRATTIVDWDGRELLVPNKEFITGRLLNWSLSDTKIRLVLPVGIAYGSDVEKALRILFEIVSEHPLVLDEPEPSIIFDAFGDNSLSLAARCFLKSMENRMGVVTEINREIYRRFDEAGIVIAFPQRDVHFDSDKPLRIALEQG